jgi:hypothetical protein
MTLAAPGRHKVNGEICGCRGDEESTLSLKNDGDRKGRQGECDGPRKVGSICSFLRAGCEWR